MPRRRSIRVKTLSEINIVPYIDVMLVLLIIFMITTPLIEEGIKINLPTSKPYPESEEAEATTEKPVRPTILKIKADGSLYLSSEGLAEVMLTAETLSIAMEKILAVQPNVQIQVKGEGDASYQQVISIVDILRQVGVEKVNLVTRPIEE